ncbi:transcriptional regulator of acetoin/glycerol metabolism [Psychromicrobium silvestre]|uniref:Transcriptional regulator of acetoin/glycerol metabolism n=1 Tax=Psychromicrobium silvestre TaxID=1645614 RepID=A0A7Y9LW33_9MICC|nr:GAF domain-containing protein [Psychromicrobium silvestre]NYE96600.1 transcriptional regulator of acetoin/glycerol metabolism [Psychromicrobium silvestre]
MPSSTGAVSTIGQLALTDAELQRRAFSAHERLADLRTVDSRLRAVVRASWERSLNHLQDLRTAQPATVWGEQELRDYRDTHPLAAVMPVIRKLLIPSGKHSGLLIAVGDEAGRLLWVEGEQKLRDRAENTGFMAGTDWSEAAMGTSAPGTALALGRGVQIAGAEHFNQIVYSWNCTAVPIHDPASGRLLGVVDISGDSSAVESHALSLVEATVAAATAELSLQQLRTQLATPHRPGFRRKPELVAPSPSLQILGRDRGLLNLGGEAITLSERHTELITLLALHPAGLSAEELTEMIYPRGTPASTVRAELLRLRRLLQAQGNTLELKSRPYRLLPKLSLDAHQVLSQLSRGAHRLALDGYRGLLLPRSEALAIITFRTEVSHLLREAILNDAGPDAFLQYLRLPEVAQDDIAWRAALSLLPPRSPRRAAVVAHLERLARETP